MPSSPVWAHYAGEATIDGHDGRAQFRLPMHQCPEGHISAWRLGEDSFTDLATSEEPIDYGFLLAGTVEARRLLGRAKCGQCGQRLRLEATGRRLEGPVRLPIDGQTEAAEFEVDLPEVACRACTARPSPDSSAIKNTSADVTRWLFELIADGMPPDRALRVEPPVACP